METIDLGAGFNLNDSKPPDIERPNNEPSVKITTKKQMQISFKKK